MVTAQLSNASSKMQWMSIQSVQSACGETHFVDANVILLWKNVMLKDKIEPYFYM